jgi:hypothetical protein
MRKAVLLAVAASVGLSGAVAQAQSASPAAARLQGQFRMAGRVTRASNVHGVHVGDKVTRTWTFTPGCPTGACGTVVLVRNRGRGTDRVTLHRKRPGYYTGHSSFYAPLRCGGRVYKRGELVPFTITVRVRAAAVSGGIVVATRISGSYTNRSRTNRTPCVLLPGHDAATYRGQLI